jgi:phosphomannomutase
MQEVFVFDVDGTLTPPRSQMEDAMARIMRQLVVARPVYLVTGSDLGKLRSQVPWDIAERAEGLFCCSGNEMWRGSRLVYEMRHAFPDELIALAERLVQSASYGMRTGRHVEARTGALNISVIGRNASMLQRRDYLRHDRQTGERDRIIAEIEKQFPEYEANRGGQISIDIAPRGWNKGRIVREVRSRIPDAAIRFFGDSIGEGGNDRPLAEALRAAGGEYSIHAVSGHSETLAILRTLTGHADRTTEVA